MLYRTSVQEVKNGRISKRHGHIAVAMQHYPRFLPKALVDEYLRSLAPERGLFREFKNLEREILDHDEAFRRVNYEQRFWLTTDGMENLERLSREAASRDVFLVCQCAATQKCHADLLLLMARARFNARTQTPRREYCDFQARLL